MDRKLKIEPGGASDGARWSAISKIRLKGQWLAAAGFPAGARVSIIPLENGRLELRAEIPQL